MLTISDKMSAPGEEEKGKKNSENDKKVEEKSVNQSFCSKKITNNMFMYIFPKKK